MTTAVYPYEQLNLRCDLKDGRTGIITRSKYELMSCYTIRISGSGRLIPDSLISKIYSPEECGYVKVADNKYMENAFADVKYWDEDYVQKWEQKLNSNATNIAN